MEFVWWNKNRWEQLEAYLGPSSITELVLTRARALIWLYVDAKSLSKLIEFHKALSMKYYRFSEIKVPLSWVGTLHKIYVIYHGTGASGRLYNTMDEVEI